MDFQSLYEEKAPAYSACFREGAWFRRGLPVRSTAGCSPGSDSEFGCPPADGIPTCQRGAGESLDGCWGICLASDVIHAADRQKLIDVVAGLAGETSNFLAVKPAVNLTFTASTGAYERALASRGYREMSRACAFDCTALSGVAVDPTYCAAGASLSTGYDVVLSVTKPPGVQGIAGTGSSCASDQKGRPLWIVLSWHSSIVGAICACACACACVALLHCRSDRPRSSSTDPPHAP